MVFSFDLAMSDWRQFQLNIARQAIGLIL